MSIPDTGGGGGGVGTIVQLGFAAADWLNRNTGWNKQQRLDAKAAREAGYSREGDGRLSGWVDPSGQPVLERDMLRAGRAIRTAIAPTQTGTLNPPTYQNPVGGARPTPPITPTGGPTYQNPVNADRMAREQLERAVREAARRASGATFKRPPIIDPNKVPPVVRAGRFGRFGPWFVTAGITLAPYLWRAVEELRKLKLPRSSSPWSGRGPKRRFKRRRVRKPDNKQPRVPSPDDIRIPAPTPTRVRVPGTSSSPKPSTRSRPQPMPVPGLPPQIITATPTRVPSLRTIPWSDIARYALPLAPSLLVSSGAPPKSRPPLTPVQSPQLPFSASPVAPNACPPCKCDANRERKRSRKKRCRNPVTSKKKYARGGRRFEQITRRLEC